MVIAAEQIVKLIGCLGTVEGLAQVGSEITRLNASLVEPQSGFARAELDQVTVALTALSRAILQMGRVTQTVVRESGVGVNDYAG